DEEQRLPRLHPCAFGEKAFLEDAGDARADLDLLRALRLADVLVRRRQRPWLHDHRRHLRGRKALKASLLLLPACRDEGGDCKGCEKRETTREGAWGGRRGE